MRFRYFGYLLLFSSSILYAFPSAWADSLNGFAEQVRDYKKGNAVYLEAAYSRPDFIYPEFEKLWLALEQNSPNSSLEILDSIRLTHPAAREIVNSFKAEFAIKAGDYGAFHGLQEKVTYKALRKRILGSLVKRVSEAKGKIPLKSLEQMEEDFPELSAENAFQFQKLKFHKSGTDGHDRIVKQMWLNGEYSDYLPLSRYKGTLGRIEKNAGLEDWQAYLRKQYLLKDYRQVAGSGKKAIGLFLKKGKRPPSIYLVYVRALEKLRHHRTILKLLEDSRNASIFSSRGHELRQVKLNAYLRLKKYQRADRYIAALVRNKINPKTINALNLKMGERFFYFEQDFKKAQKYYDKLNTRYFTAYKTEKLQWERYLLHHVLNNRKKLAELYRWALKRDFVSSEFGSAFCYWILKNRKIHRHEPPRLNPCLHLYPNSYYAHKSLQIVNEHKNTGLREQKVDFRKEGLSRSEVELLELLNFLLSTNRIELAEKALEETLSPKSSNTFLIGGVLLLEKHQRYFSIQRILIRKSGEDWLKNPEQRSIAFRFYYPKAYENSVRKVSNQYGLEENIVYSIMREESHFNQTIASPAGAIGLMQLMPATAKEIARQKKRKYRFAHILDGHTNLDYGAFYFSGLMKRFDNIRELSLAAYNGGPSNVKKWAKKYGIKDIDLFIEMIPFRETRRYVKKVMRSYMVYNMLYP